MVRVRSLLLVALAVTAMLAVTAPALATEGSTEEETTTTTVAEEPQFENGEPAVVIPPAEEAEEDQPWTSRFIYPTIVIGTILLIVGIAWAYNRRIRHRYNVVPD